MIAWKNIKRIKLKRSGFWHGLNQPHHTWQVAVCAQYGSRDGTGAQPVLLCHPFICSNSLFKIILHFNRCPWCWNASRPTTDAHIVFFLGLDLHLLFAMRIFLVGNEGRIDFLPLLLDAYRWTLSWSSFWHRMSIINLLLETVRVALWSEISPALKLWEIRVPKDHLQRTEVGSLFLYLL